MNIEGKLGEIYAKSAEYAAALGSHLYAGESPIEQLFAAALWSRGWGGPVFQMKNGAALSEIVERSRRWGEAMGCVCIQYACQVQLTSYRVDFLVASYVGEGRPPVLVAVECDGHEFHEKTREQAARDKRKDRDLARMGVTTMRFAGSEIWGDAGRCAVEVLGLVFARQDEARAA